MMKPPGPTMEYAKIKQELDHTAQPSQSSQAMKSDGNTTMASDPRGQVYGCHVTSEKVANATITLKQLLRKQTLAYQSHIMDAVRNGDVSELKRFLEQKEGKLNVNFFDKEGQTALHQSCYEGNFELVKILVKHGADTRLTNREGWNPLHVATFGGHKDIAVFLINLHSR